MLKILFHYSISKRSRWLLLSIWLNMQDKTVQYVKDNMWYPIYSPLVHEKWTPTNKELLVDLCFNFVKFQTAFWHVMDIQFQFFIHFYLLAMSSEPKIVKTKRSRPHREALYILILSMYYYWQRNWSLQWLRDVCMIYQ